MYKIYQLISKVMIRNIYNHIIKKSLKYSCLENVHSLMLIFLQTSFRGSVQLDSLTFVVFAICVIDVISRRNQFSVLTDFCFCTNACDLHVLHHVTYFRLMHGYELLRNSFSDKDVHWIMMIIIW